MASHGEELTGFDTIGNATLIFYDRGRPVLATDPWIDGCPYFGSWSMSHEIPVAQREAILGADHIWFSHGHPDHINWDSLELLRQKHLLIPNHFGGRILKDLRSQGFNADPMADREWVALSDSIRVMCIANHFQDAILLADVNGRLVANFNDSSDHGWGRTVRKIIAEYETSFLLNLMGRGDADMINFMSEDGQRIVPPAMQRPPVGKWLCDLMEWFGAKYFIPFSAMHRYHRADSAWANDCVTQMSDYEIGFDEKKRGSLLPAFIRYNCTTDQWTEINPNVLPVEIVPPEQFGDHWSDPLEAADQRLLTKYFRSFEHLSTFLDFVTFRVGGRDHVVELAPRKYRRGITFEVPRHSLMKAVEYEIFDDLLIGNFMKTTLHGSWGAGKLYPDFTPYITKYGDNGRAKTREELRAYFQHYRNRALIESMLHELLQLARHHVINRVPQNSPFFASAKGVFRALRRTL